MAATERCHCKRFVVATTCIFALMTSTTVTSSREESVDLECPRCKSLPFPSAFMNDESSYPVILSFLHIDLYSSASDIEEIICHEVNFIVTS